EILVLLRDNDEIVIDVFDQVWIGSIVRSRSACATTWLDDRCSDLDTGIGQTSECPSPQSENNGVSIRRNRKYRRRDDGRCPQINLQGDLRARRWNRGRVIRKSRSRKR